jgi:hypothetical protein
LTEEEASMGIGAEMEGSGDGFALAAKNTARSITRGINYRNKLIDLAAKSEKAIDSVRTELHHLVGRGWGNLKRFGNTKINDLSNLRRLDPKLHRQITQFYNRGKNYYDFLKGSRTLQEYVSKLPFEKQMDWGLSMLGYLYENGTMEGFIDKVVPYLPKW